MYFYAPFILSSTARKRLILFILYSIVRFRHDDSNTKQNPLTYAFQFAKIRRNCACIYYLFKTQLNNIVPCKYK